MLDIENLGFFRKFDTITIVMQQQDFFICRSGSNGITATTSKQQYIFISKPGHQMCIFFNVSFRAEEKHCQLPSFVLSVSMIQLRVVNSENSYQCVLTDIFSVWFRVLSSHLNISLSVTFFSCGQSSTANYSTSNYSFSFLIKSQTKNPLADNPKATVLWDSGERRPAVISFFPRPVKFLFVIGE